MLKSSLLALVVLTTPALAETSIIDNNQVVTHDCASDGEVRIIGNHAKVALTGTCAKLTIAGNHASVTGSVTTALIAGNHNLAALDGVDRLTIAGNHNVATWKRALSAKLKKPRISNPGRYNKVSRAK